MTHEPEHLTDDRGREFTPAERAELRKLKRDWDRCGWVWKVFVQAVAYSAAIIAALYASKDVLGRVIRAILGVHQ